MSVNTGDTFIMFNWAVFWGGGGLVRLSSPHAPLMLTNTYSAYGRELPNIRVSNRIHEDPGDLLFFCCLSGPEHTKCVLINSISLGGEANAF